MKRWLAILSLFLVPAASFAERVNFDGEPAGAAPVQWTCGVTGRGQPHWVIDDDQKAPSPPHVLVQRGQGDFPWCVKSGTALADGYVEVKFRPMAGNEDQAGGVVWRWKDANRYYVARANALENNVSIYYTEGGKRKALRYVDAPVEANMWHTLRVEFSGSHINVMLDGKRYIDIDDGHIAGAGAVGVWTKADSITAFDDFSFGAVGN